MHDDHEPPAGAIEGEPVPGRHASSPAPRRRSARWIALLAVVLAVVGAVLIVVAVRTSRSGPPQPSSEAAGVVDPYASSAGPTPSASSPPPSPAGAAGPVSPTSASTTPRTTVKASPTTRPTTTRTSPSTSAAPTSTAPRTVTHTPPPTHGPVLSASTPVSMSIPALGVTSDLLQLGLNTDGTVQVPDLNDPDSKAGWYKYSPTPGAVGPAIILGHIDSAKYGPGVFYRLGDLKPGDQVSITRRDGTVAVFEIDGVRSYPKNDFPTPTVYGNLDYAGLRLITCGGVFDPDAHSYESNIVAFASLVSSHHA